MIQTLMGWCVIVLSVLLVITALAFFEKGGRGVALFCLFVATGPLAGILIGREHLDHLKSEKSPLVASPPKMAEAVSAPMVATVECSCSCDAQGRRRLDINTPAKENP